MRCKVPTAATEITHEETLNMPCIDAAHPITKQVYVGQRREQRLSV